ncbi:hypothetical protein RJZ56_001986 [Blastomyces dermatitidis]|uniref:Uncharacterized protein n=1 Tax=Ajellomyces dermatitidis (strain ATCC 18188 / CBS 674.68) TaxID=653446 RepID=A0A0J9EQ80_AJEDA|nr:hypothetical protein BDDG_12079 [Blastomyces dermatitidis ATCC 18188]
MPPDHKLGHDRHYQLVEQRQDCLQQTHSSASIYAATANMDLLVGSGKKRDSRRRELLEDL